MKNVNWTLRIMTYSLWYGGLLLLALGAFIIVPKMASAAGGLMVTPQLVELDSRQRSKVLTLANRGNKTETYRISVINYRMDKEGNMHPTDVPAGEERFAAGLFRYAPRQITLKPGKPQTVRILYRRPATISEGEYRSHLLFQQIPEAIPTAAKSSSASGLSVKIQTIFGISIPVIVRHGKLEATGTLANLQPTQTVNGRPGLSMRISRTGQRSLRGDLVAFTGEDEIGRLNNVAVYLSTPYRRVILPLTPEMAQSAAGKEIIVEYRERSGTKRAETTAPTIATNAITLR